MQGESEKIKLTHSPMEATDERLVRYFSWYVISRMPGLNRDDISQELRLESWLARKKWRSEEKASWKTFLYRRLQWRASNLLRGAARQLTLERAFYQRHSSGHRWGRDRMVGDFCAPSQTICHLSYELQQSLKSNEARKVFRAMQTPTELIAPEGGCLTTKQVASYLGIAEISVTRGLREIKRHLRAILNEQR